MLKLPGRPPFARNAPSKLNNSNQAASGNCEPANASASETTANFTARHFHRKSNRESDVIVWPLKENTFDKQPGCRQQPGCCFLISRHTIDFQDELALGCSIPKLAYLLPMSLLAAD